MKFIDAGFQDKVCFVTETTSSFFKKPCFHQDEEFTDSTLCDFLNLSVKDYKSDSSFENLESFCRKNGSLIIKDWLPSLPVPRGFSTLELQNYSTRFSSDKIYYEEISEWKKHILAFNDLCHLAYIDCYNSRIDYFNIVRYLTKTMIHYKDKDGRCYYLFYGQSSFKSIDDSNFKLYLPQEIQGIINFVGEPFLFTSNTEFEDDSIEHRQSWMLKNIKEIFRKYEEQYFEVCKVNEINLLGKLQSSLEYWMHQRRPLSLCLLCGKFFLPVGDGVISGHFCSGLCQSRFYQKKDLYKQALIDTTAFEENDFKRLFNAKNRKF